MYYSIYSQGFHQFSPLVFHGYRCEKSVENVENGLIPDNERVWKNAIYANTALF